MTTQKDVDATPLQPIVIPSSLPRPYCERDGITLYHGDSFALWRLAELTKADIVVTDPPYGIDLQHWDRPGSKQHSGIAGDDVYFDWQAFADLPCVEQFWFGAENYRKTLPDGGSWICWDKYPTDTGERLAGQFELCWSRQRHAYRIARQKAVNTSWATVQERNGHPTQKPERLMRWLIDKYAKGGRVVDFFAGSGTTLVAARDCGVQAIGFEIEEKWCEVAAKRLSQGVLF